MCIIIRNTAATGMAITVDEADMVATAGMVDTADTVAMVDLVPGLAWVWAWALVSDY